MPVNSHHPSYDLAFTEWQRVREVLAGEDSVKAAGERYLPRVQSHTDDEYNLYRQRASFFNATARTAEGYVGLIFRRPPWIKLPDSTVTGNQVVYRIPDLNALPKTVITKADQNGRRNGNGSENGNGLTYAHGNSEENGASQPTSEDTTPDPQLPPRPSGPKNPYKGAVQEKLERFLED